MKEKAIAYVRVSTKSQEEEGYSIPVQIQMANDYAEKKNLDIVHLFQESASASKGKRKVFHQAIDFLLRHGIKHLIVEKYDRFGRNPYDHSQLYKLIEKHHCQIHFVRDGRVLDHDSPMAEFMLCDINFVFSHMYGKNLSQEAKKGRLQAAKEGRFTGGSSPIGYRYCKNTKVLLEDHSQSAFVKRAFALYATGTYSLKGLRKQLKNEGWFVGKSKSQISKNTLQRILTNPTYIGKKPFLGELYDGQQVALVSDSQFQQVQEVLAGKSRPTRQTKHLYSYTGFLSCSECNHAVTAEKKKNRYIYYRCTQAREGCQNMRQHVREEVIEDQFISALTQIRPTASQLVQLSGSLSDFHKKDRNRSQKDLQALHNKSDELHIKIEQALDEKAAGNIPDSVWVKLVSKWKKEEAILSKAMDSHQEFGEYYNDTDYLSSLFQRAPELYQRQSIAEKRKMLGVLLKEKAVVVMDRVNFMLDFV